ncbi:hypothetical protein LguiA_002643 [Lonicera macranthoides]
MQHMSFISVFTKRAKQGYMLPNIYFLQFRSDPLMQESNAWMGLIFGLTIHKVV